MKYKLFFCLFSIFIVVSCSKNDNKHLSKNKFKNKEINKIERLITKSNSRNNTDETIKSLKWSLNVVKKLDNTIELRNVLSKIVFQYYFIQNNEGINNSSKLLLKLSKKSKDSVNLGIAYRSRAYYFNQINNIDSSFSYYFKAEKIYFNLNDKTNYASVLLNKGLVQYRGGDNLRAELALNIAYSIFIELDDENMQIQALIGLGNVSDELKDYDKALIYYYKALDKAVKLKTDNTDLRIPTCYNNIGFVLIRQKQYKKAIDIFKKGLASLDINKDPDLYSSLIDNLAYCKLKSNDFSELPEMFYESLKIRDSLNSIPNIVLSYIHLSQFYSLNNENQKAIKFAYRALLKAQLSKNPLDVLASLHQVAEVDVNNAIEVNKKYINLSDSLQIAERKSRDRFARIQLETDEIIKEKDDLEGKSKNYFYLIIGLVVFGGGFFVIRNQITRTKILRYKQAQQAANEEIFNLMMSQQSQIDTTRAEEKRKISRDLHDGVLGRLFGARLSLESLNTMDDDDAVAMRHNYIEELKKIEQDIREISHDLNREKLEVVNNFLAIVTALIEDQNKNHTATTTLTIDPTINWNTISSIKKINTYRIIQEALQNCNKYAQADTIFVTIAKENTHYKISVKDNGVGYDVAKKAKGIGTKNMIERTEECKGIFEVNSKIGKGSEVIVMIPLEDKQPKQDPTA